MPKIFLIKNRLLQQQQRLLENSKQSTESSLDDGEEIERDTTPCHQRITPRSLFGKHFIRSSPPPLPPPPDSDHDNDSDEPLSLVVHKGTYIHTKLITNIYRFCLFLIKIRDFAFTTFDNLMALFCKQSFNNNWDTVTLIIRLNLILILKPDYKGC